MQVIAKITVPTLAFTLAFLAIPGLKAAGVYPNCASGTLKSYEAGGSNDFSCAIGGTSGGVAIIDGFLYSGPAGDDSLIQLVPDVAGLGGGFNYSGFPAATTGQTLDFNITYFYTIDPGPVGAGANLGMDPPVGNVVISESICVDSYFNAPFDGTSCSNGDAVQSLSVNDNDPPVSWTSEIALDPVAKFGADVEIQVVETGGAEGAGFDSTTAVQTIVNSTPEPVSTLLCLGGLIAIGAFRRYRKVG